MRSLCGEIGRADKRLLSWMARSPGATNASPSSRPVVALRSCDLRCHLSPHIGTLENGLRGEGVLCSVKRLRSSRGLGGRWCRCPERTGRRTVVRSVGPRLSGHEGLPVVRRGAEAPRRRPAHRSRQGAVLRLFAHPPPHRNGREGRRDAVSPHVGDWTAQEVPDRLCRPGPGHLLSAARCSRASSAPRDRENVELIVARQTATSRRWPSEPPSTWFREGVDLVIEFQTDEAVAPAIAFHVHGGSHSAHRHRTCPSRRHLLRGQQTTRPGCSRDAIWGNGRGAAGRDGWTRCCCWSSPARARSCARA